MEPDFTGYATKAGIRCADGRTILPNAFAHQDKTTVPLVWQHGHGDVDNVLGHAVLENRDDGVYAYGYLNDGAKGRQAGQLLAHGDIEALSIYANQLQESNKVVRHGVIKEVSLVLSGANPGALIDNVNIRHSDGLIEELDGEAVIYTGLVLEHAAPSNATTEENNVTTPNNSGSDKTVQDVFDAMTEEQKNVVYFMVGAALEESADDDDDDTEIAQSDIATDDGSGIITHKEAFEMIRNVFEMNKDNGNAMQHDGLSAQDAEGVTLMHDNLGTIVADAQKMGSLKDAVLSHADTYGINDIDILFPDARTISNTPEFLQRRTEWVTKVLGGIKKSPFSRIKTIVADITADEARAKGYVTGNLKKEEVIRLLTRKTDPTTIYKKQKLDRDDIVDITDFDVVVWLKGEMRLMLDEEIARAILVGDGRSYGDEDKVDDTSIRPIATDDPMYAHQITVDSTASPEMVIEQFIRARSYFKGSGQPTFFTTLPFLTDMLLVKDKMGRRVYESKQDLANALMAKEVVEVEVMENTDYLGIYVALGDYTAGANRGGEVSMFDDFDIDYNQHKYLIETRMSGALTRPKSAVVISREAGTLVTPVAPSFDGLTNTITIPTVTGVEYTIEGIPVTGDEVISSDTEVQARPTADYSFPANVTTNWTYAYSA